MSSETQLPQRGDIIASKYQVEGMLGSGGMGAVFRVSHRVTGKMFAVKWLLPRLTGESDAVQRFIREAQVAGRVDHPNVVEVYDVGQQGDSFYMVMELLHGESLAQRIATQGTLSVAETSRILISVARGLSAVHDAGIIHRDLKPENIFLCAGVDGEVMPKLLDFGISKMTHLQGQVTAGITREGAIMGSPHYMAPEQLRGLNVDVRTDVYGLGVIMYQALAGVLPFPGDNYSDLVLRIMTETPKPLTALLPDTPRALVELIAKAMMRDPAQRFESVADLAHAVEPFAQGLRFDRPRPTPSLQPMPTVPGTPTPMVVEHPSFERSFGTAPRGLLVWSLATLGVVVLGLTVAFFSIHGSVSHTALPAEQPTAALPRSAASAASSPVGSANNSVTPEGSSAPAEGKHVRDDLPNVLPLPRQDPPNEILSSDVSAVVPPKATLPSRPEPRAKRPNTKLDTKPTPPLIPLLKPVVVSKPALPPASESTTQRRTPQLAPSDF